jgi:hypothetical protein
MLQKECQKKRWKSASEELLLPKSPTLARRTSILDQIFVRIIYDLLPGYSSFQQDVFCQLYLDIIIACLPR